MLNALTPMTSLFTTTFSKVPLYASFSLDYTLWLLAPQLLIPGQGHTKPLLQCEEGNNVEDGVWPRYFPSISPWVPLYEVQKTRHIVQN
jgi:hypothetical protein